MNAVQTFKPQLASGWLTQFQQGVQKYRMPESDAAPLRFALLHNIFKLIEAEDPIPDDDFKYLAAVATEYKIGESGITDLQDICSRVLLRKQIQLWEAGTIPRTDCKGLILQKGEVCHWEEQAALRVQRTKHEYVGGYSGVSVPVPLVRGVRFRVGGFKGHPIDHAVLEDAGSGNLHITSQRIAFTGPIAVAIAYKKMISVGGFDGGFIVQTSNEKKPGIFLVNHPELTTQMLTLAANPPVEKPSRNARAGEPAG